MKDIVSDRAAAHQKLPLHQSLPHGMSQAWTIAAAANTDRPLVNPRPGPVSLSAPASTGSRELARIKAYQHPMSFSNGRACLPGPVQDEWDSLPLVASNNRRHFLSGVPLVNFFRRAPAARGFDQLRSSLLQTLRINGWNRVAIASPTRGCGTTFTAVNLAQSIARVPGSRTVLMDINHRNPGIATMLDMKATGHMREFLSGDAPLNRHFVRASATLALGLASGPDETASEMLNDPRCTDALAHMKKQLRPDVVLFDLPPVLTHDDMLAFLPQVDGVLLVADGTQTQARHLAACLRVLNGRTRILGTVLNRARESGILKTEL